jgi:chromosome segregation ATPase
VEEYKKQAQSHTYENLTARIADLETKLGQKERENEDLKMSQASSSGSNVGNNDEIMGLKTKLLVSQGKLRAAENKVDELTQQLGEMEQKVLISQKQAGNFEQNEILKRQLRQEMDTTEQLRAQLNKLSTGVNAQSQQELQYYRQQLQQAQAQINQLQSSSQGGTGDSGQLRQEIAARDQQIAQLQQQLAQSGSASSAAPSGASGSGPMANLRLQREINALKSQIEMIKKNEAQMRLKYEEAMRRLQGETDDY